jgi:hypothetical protein
MTLCDIYIHTRYKMASMNGAQTDTNSLTLRMVRTVLARVNKSSLHDHPFYLVCPDVLSLVGDPLSGDRCGSPNHIQF